MAKQWYDAKMQKPPKDPRESIKVHNSDFDRSTKVIVLYKDTTYIEGYSTRFAYYSYNMQEWQIEGISSNKEGHMNEITLYWCYIPEFTGEMKTLIKTLRRGKSTTTAKKTSETY